MTIRRQYQLPNCSLILDGLSIDPSPGSENVMSLLVNAECRISGLERSLNGGYNFFAALVRAVSQYGQEVLSGFAHPQVVEGEPLLVHINPGDGPYHHLVIQPEIADLGDLGDGRAIDIKLSAVQLFDLTEAVDQFFDDSQTLPELTPALAPLARRFVRSEEPLSDRAIPAVLGIGGLVAATMAIGLLPAPKLREPATSRADEAAEVAIADPANSSTPPNGETEDPAVSQIAAAPEAETDEVEPEAVTTAEAELDETAESENSGTPDTETPDVEISEAETPDAETIEGEAGASRFETNPPNALDGFENVRRLNSDLKQTLVDNREQPRFGDAVSYRVRVSEDGTVVGYEPADSAAIAAIDETPLPELVGTASEQAPAVDYRVVFTERGVVEVSPWRGWSFYE
ncbi:MAG: DUF4335 domain-containing protein [Phormidesmis sp.]